MSEDSDKLKAIMDALKNNQEFASDSSESSGKEEAKGEPQEEKQRSASGESDISGVYDEEVGGDGLEEQDKGEDMENKEDYNPSQEDSKERVGGDDEDEEVLEVVDNSTEPAEEVEMSKVYEDKSEHDDSGGGEDGGVVTREVADEDTESNSDSRERSEDDELLEDEGPEEHREKVVPEENDEKENDDDSLDHTVSKKDKIAAAAAAAVAAASASYDDDAKDSASRTKEQGTADDIDQNLLEKQVRYIVDSEMLSLPEFQELSSQEKVLAIVTLLNSNPDTTMPSKSTSVEGSEALKRRRFPPPDMSQSMTPEERQRYSEYLRGENRITEIEHFPPKSRLFIGNLPLKNVTKEDLFRIFSLYGHIFQINIKNAFGFIQYDNAQSVKDAIECESNETNFGKKLILEVSSSNSRPQFDHGDHGTNSSSTFVTSSKRPFDEQGEEDDMYSDNHYKKTKKRIPQCMILVKRTADRSYANEVFNSFRNGSGLETDMVFLKPRMELRKLINDAAYDGVWGVILVNKNRNVDIQTFYKGPQGETKFDEYISVSCEDAIAIFNNLKSSRSSLPGSISPPLQQRAKLPPQQQPRQQQQPQQPQQQQQQFYSGYSIPPQQNPYIPPQTIYGTMASAAPPPPPPPQQQQQYATMQSYAGFPAQQLPIAGPGHPNGPMDQSQLLAAIQHLPQSVISSLLSMAQQQPNQQQQVLGLIQQLQNNPQHQQHVAQQLSGNVSNPYGSFNTTPTPNVLAASPPPPPPPQQQQQQQQHQQHQQHQHQQQSKHISVPQAQPPQAGSNVQSLLDSLAQLQK